MTNSRLAVVAAACSVIVTGAVPGDASAQRPSASTSLVQDNYPRKSLALGEEGTVSFAVDLDAQGRIESCLVTASSGYPRLDEATCDLLVRFAQFTPAQADGKIVATKRTGQIKWQIPPARRIAAVPPPRVQVSLAQLESARLICRRSRATGSLLKITTHCLTKREWEVAYAEGRNISADMMGAYQSPNGCTQVSPGRTVC